VTAAVGALTLLTLTGYVAAGLAVWRRRWPLFWVTGIIANSSLAAANGLQGKWGWLAFSACVTVLSGVCLVVERRTRGDAR